MLEQQHPMSPFSPSKLGCTVYADDRVNYQDENKGDIYRDRCSGDHNGGDRIFDEIEEHDGKRVPARDAQEDADLDVHPRHDKSKQRAGQQPALDDGSDNQCENLETIGTEVCGSLLDAWIDADQ